MKDLQNLIEQTIQWNVRVGNKTHPAHTMEFDKAVALQSKLVLEEAQETFDAMQVNDYTEVLDGACDVLFTLSWLIKQLEDAGFDFEGAYQAVVDNNFKKVYSSYYEACDAKEKMEAKFDQEFFVETNVDNGIPFYVVLDVSGKVRKPVDFKAVDLDGFIPRRRHEKD